MTSMTAAQMKQLIRDVPDFPKPGILFKDITPVLKHPQAMDSVIGFMAERAAGLGAEHVTAFLNAMATRGHVAGSTQNQALAALLFLYREVLGIQLPWLSDLVHAKPPARLPVVLTRDEVRAVLGRMEGESCLMATLLYGCGLRLLECCRLRIKDVDFGRNQITVRRGKGDKDRARARDRREAPSPLARDRCPARRAPRGPGAARLQGRRHDNDLHHVLNRGPAGVQSPADRLLGG